MEPQLLSAKQPELTCPSGDRIATELQAKGVTKISTPTAGITNLQRRDHRADRSCFILPPHEHSDSVGSPHDSCSVRTEPCR
jgi:hypothetical protein